MGGAFLCAALGSRPWPVALLAAAAGGFSTAAVLRRRRRGETGAEQKLRALLESVTDAIYFKDTDLRYRYVNPAWAALVQSAPAQMSGRTDAELFGESGAQREASDRRALAGREFEELREHRADGRTFYHQCLRMPLRDSAGRVTGLLGLVRDVSEHRQLEEHAIQAQKMEGITRLAGGIAHDFNNFLTVIQANGSLLAEGISPDEERWVELNEILEASRQAADLTRQLLIFSRRQVVQSREIDVNEVLRGVGKMLRRMLPENIELAYELSPAPLICRADPGQIEQMALNLVAHGRDTMTRGGKLVLATAPLRLSAPRSNRWCRLDAGDYVEISVADTGPQIAPAVLEKIFQPFALDGTFGVNMGLGLPTVLVIVRQLGGGVAVDSGPEGTIFRMQLPATSSLPAAAPAPTPVPELSALSRPETILLVEDNVRVRKLARRILADRGYHILEAQHGEEGLKVAGQHEGKIDLVVTDIVMPLMNGDDMVRALRARQPKLKVLFMSGYNESHQLGDALSVGACQFLAKPFHPGDFAQKVRELIDAPVEG